DPRCRATPRRLTVHKHIPPAPLPGHSSVGITTLLGVPFGQFGPRFVLFAALFTSALVAAVLLVKRVPGKFDASGPCLLDSWYTEVTEAGGASRLFSSRVSYKFVAAGERYLGTDTISQRPTAREATVYYMAANPRDNGLRPPRFKHDVLIAAGVAFLI